MVDGEVSDVQREDREVSPSVGQVGVGRGRSGGQWAELVRGLGTEQWGYLTGYVEEWTVGYVSGLSEFGSV